MEVGRKYRMAAEVHAAPEAPRATGGAETPRAVEGDPRPSRQEESTGEQRNTHRAPHDESPTFDPDASAAAGRVKRQFDPEGQFQRAGRAARFEGVCPDDPRRGR